MKNLEVTSKMETQEYINEVWGRDNFKITNEQAEFILENLADFIRFAYKIKIN